jgi:hypothetical protein
MGFGSQNQFGGVAVMTASQIAALVLANAITDGDTTHAPDGNSVFDALALKVGGSTGATDNAVLRANGTGGVTAQSSGVTVSDAAVITARGLTGESGNNLMITGPAGATLYFIDPSSQAVGYINNRRFTLESLSYLSTTPAQITANQNNYSALTSDSAWLRWSSDASRNVTGMVMAVAGNLTGDYHRIVNVGAFNIVLKHQDTNSTDTNRFLSSTGADITLAPNEAAECLYDGTTQRWRVWKSGNLGFQSAVLEADFSATNDDVLSVVTGWSNPITLVAGKTYQILAQWYMSGTDGGVAFDFGGGSVVPVGLSGSLVFHDATTTVNYHFEGLGETYTSPSSGMASLNFTIEVDTTGTLIPNFAQVAADAAASAMTKYATIAATDITSI